MSSNSGSLGALTFYLRFFANSYMTLASIRYNLYFLNALKINDDALNLPLALD